MNKKGRNLCLDICDYRNNFICNLYDSAQDLSGQATDVVVTTERNGWKELSFKLPSTCEGEEGPEDNYRIQYLIADYRLRVKDDYEIDWFLISEPKVTHSAFSKNIEVKATHVCQLLKNKNLNLEFSDSEGNNVGTARDLLTTILDGTGWKVGEVAEFYEEDIAEPTIKVRSLEASSKTGSFRLIEMLCEKFDAKPVYHGESYVLLQEDPGDMDTNYKLYCEPYGDGSYSKPSGPSVYIDGKYYPFRQLTEPTEYEEGKYFWYKCKSVDIMPMNPFSEDLEDGEIPNLVVSGERKAIEVHYEKNLKDITRTLNTENIVTKLYAYGSYGDMNGLASIQTAYHDEYQYVLEQSYTSGTEFQVKDDFGALRYFTASEDLQEGDLLIWSRLDFASRSYVWNNRSRVAYSLYKEPVGEFLKLSDVSTPNQTRFNVIADATTVAEVYPEPREYTEEEQIMSQYATDEAYAEYMMTTEPYLNANETRKAMLVKRWKSAWNQWYLTTIPTTTITTIHDFYFEDENGTKRYFSTDEDIVAGYTLVHVKDVAKMINSSSGAEYELTLTPIDGAADLLFYADKETETFAAQVKNYFPALLNFDYYEKIGLLDDDMKQAVAIYQRDMVEYYQKSEKAAEDLSNGLTELSNLANSQTGFLRLAISGYTENEDKSITMTIDTERGDNGVLYRSDYLESKKNYFEWHIAKQLKSNGDPVSGTPSALFIVHDTDPVQWERVYLKKIDDRITDEGYAADYDYGLNLGDEPKKITVWGSLTGNEGGVIPPYSESDRFYLFCTVSMSGKLGALQLQDEAIMQQQITTSTAVSTEYHPFYFVDNRLVVDGKSVEPPITTVGIANQYGWYYRFYPMEDRPGDLYFCGPKDSEWHAVYYGETLPETGDILPGEYFFSTKLRVLYVLSADASTGDKSWVKMESTEEQRIATCFSQVWYLCRRRDQLYKGIYERYEYTVENMSLATGRYLIDSGYDYYWAFTTDRLIDVGSTIWVDTAYNYVYQDDDIANIVQANVIPQYAVTPMTENILSSDNFTSGWLDVDTGKEIDDSTQTNQTRTGYIEVYAGNGYESNLPKAAIILYYDGAKNYLGQHTGLSNTTFVPPEKTTIDYDSPQYKPDTKYIRIAVPATYEVQLGETNNMTEAEWRAANPDTDAWLTANGLTVYVEDVYDPSTNTTTAYFYTTTAPTNYYVRIQGYESKAIIRDNSKLAYTILSPVTPAGDLKGLNNLTKSFADLSDTIYGEYLPALRNAQAKITEEDNKLTDLLGDILRENRWQDTDYVRGDEAKLYRDALDNLKEIAWPEATYNISYLDLYGANEDMGFSADEEEPVEWPDIQITDAIHLVDPEIDVNCWAYIDKIEKWYDQPWKTNIDINTQLSLIGQHDFTDVMTRIAEVAATAKSKQALVDRISEITNEEGFVYASKLIGEWEAKLKSTESSWYTDRHGNIVFEAADGSSAMMLTGAGYCISNRKDEWGDWVYTTMATGDGIAAEKIVAGYLNVERIENYSITTEKLHSFVGQNLDISANRTLALYATADGTKPAGALRTQDSIINITAGTGTEPAHIDVMSGGEINLRAGAYSTRYILLEENPLDLQTNYANYYTKSTVDGEDVYTPLPNGNVDWAENTYYRAETYKSKSGGTINIESGAELNLSGGEITLDSGSSIDMLAGTSLYIYAGSSFVVDSPNFSIDKDGDVTIRGDIYAEGGEIAGFTIFEDETGGYIVYEQSGSNNKVWLGTDKIMLGDVKRTVDGTNVSYTTEDGQNVGQGFYADINGNVYMGGSVYIGKGGTIAGWKISDTSLMGGKLDSSGADVNTNYRIGMSSYVSSTPSNDVVFWAGRTSSTDTKFYVKADGSVGINGGSINISDNGTTNFSVTSTGELTAIKGKIGDWFISGSHIGNAAALKDSTVGIRNATGTDVVFWAGTKTYSAGESEFRVTANGKLYATGASIKSGDITITGGSIEIKSGTTTNFKVDTDGTLTAKGCSFTSGVFSGKVTAEDGSIGGWHIGSNYIGNKSTLATSTIGLYNNLTSSTPASSDVVIWAGNTSSNANFKVTAGGTLYATGANIGGTLTAGDNSKIGNWIVNGNVLYSTFSGSDYTNEIRLDSKASEYAIGIATNNISSEGVQVGGWSTTGLDGRTYVFGVDGWGQLHASNVITGVLTLNYARLNGYMVVEQDLTWTTNILTTIKTISFTSANTFYIGHAGRRFMYFGLEYAGALNYKSFVCIPIGNNNSSEQDASITLLKAVDNSWKSATIAATYS